MSSRALIAKVLIVVVASAAVIAGRKVIIPAKPVKELDISQLQFQRDIDLGQVPAQAIIKFNWEIKNQSSKTAEINWLSSDCGCTRSTETTVISPGATASLTLQFDSQRYTGEVHRRLLFSVNHISA